MGMCWACNACMDVSTVGAGGGSLAWLDSSGGLRVGPQSAGADPGPACYGWGGTVPARRPRFLLRGHLTGHTALLAGFRWGEYREAGISVSRYLSMTMGVSAACGITFELPLVTLILHYLGLLSVSFLTEHRRYAVLLGAIFTAIITPTPDAFTMSTLLLPLLGLYEISIVLMRLAERRQKTRVTRV
jgi:hypothetical protein